MSAKVIISRAALADLKTFIQFKVEGTLLIYSGLAETLERSSEQQSNFEGSI